MNHALSLFAYSNRITLQLLNHLVDLTKFARDVDALWTMGFTLPTLNAMVWLAITGNNTIQRDEILATMLTIFLVANSRWQ